ncbi:MAG: hypothetical protein K2X08_01360, partial [Chlamydiales bacterium]|nr:hypothetical protein [Chlamydiales bacterium]
PQPPEMPVSQVSPKTLIANIKEWTMYADQLPADEAHYYLHQCIRELPIPIEKNKQWWDHQPPLAAVEALHELLYRLNTTTVRGSSQKNKELLVVSYYTLYAIIDYLCRKLPEAHIPEHLTSNATKLILWLQSPTGSFANFRSYEQFIHLLEYFGIDLAKTYSDKDLRVMNNHSLFRLGTNSIAMLDTLPKLTYTATILEEQISTLTGDDSRTSSWTAEMEYYRSLLQDEKVAKRIELHFTKLQSIKNPSSYEKLQLLFQDPSYKESLAGKEDAIKMDYLEEMGKLADTPEDPRLGMLPRSVYILRLTHLLVSSSQILKKAEDNYPPELEIEKCYLTLPPWMDAIRKKFNQLTGHLFANQDFYSNIISLPLPHPHTVSFEQLPVALNALIESTHSTETFFRPLRREWGYFSRTQNEIVLEPKNYFSHASREENQVLEMLRTDPADQVVRALSFFSQEKHLLKNVDYFILFQLLVHNTSALHKALIERPPLAKEIGRQFQHLLDYFNRQK